MVQEAEMELAAARSIRLQAEVVCNPLCVCVAELHKLVGFDLFSLCLFEIMAVVVVISCWRLNICRVEQNCVTGKGSCDW